MRPQNFPTIRLSQMAVFLNKSVSIFEKSENLFHVSDFLSKLSCAATAYWDSHYVFDRESKKKIKMMGKDFTNNLIYNSIIPLLISYGIATGKNQLIKKYKDWLFSTPPENNKSVRFLRHLIIPKNPFESQSLLELYNDFCKNDRCDECCIAQDIRQSQKSAY
jgi:hypothetical protein